MQELVRHVAAEVGTDEETARRAIGTLLAFVHENAEEADAQALFEQVPDAAALAEEGAVQAADAGSGGSAGGLMGMLGGMLGGNMGAAMRTLERLQGLGLDTGQIGAIGKALFRHLKSEADEELVRRILDDLGGKVPMLDRFL